MEETNDTMIKDYLSQFPIIKQPVGPLISYHNLTFTFDSLRVQLSQITTPNSTLGLVQSGFKILRRGRRLLPVLKCMEGDCSLIGKKKKEFSVLSIPLFYLTIR